MRLNSWLLFTLMLIAAACGNKGDGLGLGVKPNTDAATKIAGTYDVSRIAVSGSGTDDFDVMLPRTLTSNGVTGTQTSSLTVTKATETTVTIQIVLKTPGQTDYTEDFGTFTTNGSTLTFNNVNAGTADGTNMNIDYTDTDKVRTIVVGKKR